MEEQWSNGEPQTLASRLDLVLTVAHVLHNLALGSDGLDGCEELRCLMRALLDTDKFAGSLAACQTVANLGVSDLAHTTTERVPDQESLIDDGLALKVFVIRESDSFIDALCGIDSRRQPFDALPCGPDNRFRLISEVCCGSAMSD